MRETGRGEKKMRDVNLSERMGGGRVGKAEKQNVN